MVVSEENGGFVGLWESGQNALRGGAVWFEECVLLTKKLQIPIIA